jgi:hypothetical protein
MRRSAQFALFMILIAQPFGVTSASTIYSQTTPSQPTGAFASNEAGNPTDQKIADNFLFSAPGSVTIRSLRFIGGYGVNNPPPLTPPLNALPPDDFRVVFFANSSGVPGSPLVSGDFHVGAAVQRTPTGGPLLNSIETPIEYFVDLRAGVTLSPAIPYWISIVNNPGPNYGWAWARAAGVYDQQVAATLGDISTGPWSVTTAGGMFFELSDNNVPEPTSFGVFLSIALGILCFRVARHSREKQRCQEPNWIRVPTLFLPPTVRPSPCLPLCAHVNTLSLCH